MPKLTQKTTDTAPTLFDTTTYQKKRQYNYYEWEDGNPEEDEPEVYKPVKKPAPDEPVGFTRLDLLCDYYYGKTMRILTAAHHWLTKSLWIRYPNHIGCIVQPGKLGKFDLQIPYALDNRAHSCWINGLDWDEAVKPAFIKMLEFYADLVHQPDWVAVPDVVCDPAATSKNWEEWQSVVANYGFKCAFVVQDGHQLSDVPSNADFVFIGGSKAWKKRAIKEFCPNFPCHVGAVNNNLDLWFAYCAGAISCDGSGWFRGDNRQAKILLDYLAAVCLDADDYSDESSKHPVNRQLSLF